jgi:hypothetical protein
MHDHEHRQQDAQVVEEENSGPGLLDFASGRMAGDLAWNRRIRFASVLGGSEEVCHGRWLSRIEIEAASCRLTLVFRLARRKIILASAISEKIRTAEPSGRGLGAQSAWRHTSAREVD